MDTTSGTVQAISGSSRRQHRYWLAVLSPFLVLCCGCPPVDQNPPVGDDTQTFPGKISTASDVGRFDLGELSPGDRVQVDVRATSGDLDPVAAIFDSRDFLVALNDDRAPDGSNRDPFLDIIIRGDTDTYYLAVISYPATATTGSYSASVTITPDVGKPAPQRQIVYLNWAGGRNVSIPNIDNSLDLDVFDAAAVGLESTQTAALKDRVQELIEARFDGFDLQVLNSDDNARPSDAHTTIYFGGSNRQAFAIAEKIDTFNQDPSDDALVFTESFAFAFAGPTTLEQIAQAMANTIAHETAHLLGLVHTHDCDGIMDTACVSIRLLAPQEFRTSEIDESVFPFGYQDATEILSWILGYTGLDSLLNSPE